MVYGLVFFILCIYFQMNSIDFALNIWLLVVSLLALHPPNWHLHLQRNSVVFYRQLSGLWLACVKYHGRRIDGMMRSICWCLLACYSLWRHLCTVLSMTNWFSWSLRRETQIYLFSHSLYYLWDSSSDHQQRIMRSYLYKHTDGDQIHLQALLR